MNKKITGITTVVIVILVLIFLTQRGTPKSGEPLKIGIAVPLSGDYGTFGESVRNGALIAQNDLANQGKKIDLVFEDACLPKDSVSAITKMITADKIDVLGGSFCLIGLIPSLPILEQNKVIAFNTAANPGAVLNKTYLVSTNFSIKSDAEKIATFIASTLKAKNMALVYYDNDFGQSYANYIQAKLKTENVNVSFIQATKSDTKDFRTTLSKIKAAKPDAVAVIELGDSIGVFLKQAKEFNIQAPMVGYYENEDPSLFKTAGNSAEGFIISSADSQTKTAVTSAFEAKYTETYKKAPDSLVLNTYDAVQIQSLGFDSCGHNPDCLIKFFKSIKDYRGVSGIITINADGSASKPTVFKVVRDGKFVLY